MYVQDEPSRPPIRQNAHQKQRERGCAAGRKKLTRAGPCAVSQMTPLARCYVPCRPPPLAPRMPACAESGGAGSTWPASRVLCLSTCLGRAAHAASAFDASGAQRYHANMRPIGVPGVPAPEMPPNPVAMPTPSRDADLDSRATLECIVRGPTSDLRHLPALHRCQRCIVC